ncbi:ferredoxin [Pseudarthrobacter sp. IC2-21]|jgi:ferredoxin|uniref:ferredoxin n=1 Tax=Pseudarthrobacter sp. IC2-21 TaxID=3092262 RepID=UPI002A6A4384|nr:ferredoxin [Pseudarthrobacter sp. IC2-21]
MSASLHIDWTRCDGRGLCTELLAGVLDRDDWGYPVARGRVGPDRTDVPLADADLEAARDAVALCPVLALTLQQDTGREGASGSRQRGRR